MRTTLGALGCLALLIGGATRSAAQEPYQRELKQDRWQIELRSGKYLWDVQLVKLAGTSLVVRQAAKTLTVPVREISMLRLVAPPAATPAREGAAVGTGDEIYQLTLRDLSERLAIIREILQRHPPPTT
jgi:hypothetical protein